MGCEDTLRLFERATKVGVCHVEEETLFQPIFSKILSVQSVRFNLVVNGQWITDKSGVDSSSKYVTFWNLKLRSSPYLFRTPMLPILKNPI